ncbi:MAG: hypothetical protein NBV67_00910 [Tagaea sp.]|nr:hypothetical protein [Tagaea sp.]
MTAPVVPAPEATLAERLYAGTQLAIRTIAGKPLHLSEGVQVRAIAHGAIAWRELMEGVLAGNEEALALARRAVASIRLPEPEPTKGT